MKIFKCENRKIDNVTSLIQALNIDINKKMIISFVGGGGKTSSIYELGSELSKLGKKVIITTTTHMQMPEKNFALTDKENDILNLLDTENIITVGQKCIKKSDDDKYRNLISKENIVCDKNKCREKIQGFSIESTKNLIKYCDFLLIEADGAKRLPLKIPANHEPVILEESNLVIGVCGIDAVGQSIKEICHRKELVTEFLNVDEEHKINEEDIAQILSSEKGQRKNVKCDYKVIVNKVDNEEKLNIAKNIFNEFLKLGINELIFTTFKNYI
ncbi:selenium cofactor biosynthesis protein YqeC [Clostridium botulinum]|uniref:selenium cofactor biosynthesis protein YqeC n=1 Tax=Clostridium botulinum TaxID=1491 RepID=UPI0007742A6B|nr:selenium cofactor biosynthesis protein YqeC [Clostridium botulinum]MBY6930492.1 putative selenium-dependent hydroxylase accessory protein YqeC [Clostridium botulinum]NFG19452.1 putative selenium-dependent hydroxylase accessory protein YqeC [Clostridium botulinum]NFO79443.1 putative selenium-dependent hydroxylase accessory protein YqeC [Clostridium botulinum]